MSIEFTPRATSAPRRRAGGVSVSSEPLPDMAGSVGSSPSGGGQTAKDPSGWSTDTLKDYLERIVHESDRRYEQRFEAQEKAVRAALDSAALAVTKAETDNLKWREAANEWRLAMGDRERNFMPRNESVSEFGNLEKQLAEHVKSRGILIESLQKQITDLQTYRAANEGKSTGLHAGWGYLVGAVGFLATIIAVILALI